MEKKNILKTSAIATGAILVGSVSNVQASNLFDSQDLGSGAELRTQLLDLNNAVPSFVSNNDIELKCGEGKCGEKSKKAEGKTSEHKCGEGKCGEKSKKAESKTSEHKCGEKETKAVKKAESKTSEHKCGEGKCGK